jgi:glycosyltransferase involved in cell wall biosynthesis
MAKEKKILLVYKFNHPDVESMRAALAAQFPQNPIELLNIKEMIRSHPGIYLANTFYLVKEYPLRQILGYWKVWRRFWATTYMHCQVRRLVNRHAAAGDYLFTFQTQSDFDASCDGYRISSIRTRPISRTYIPPVIQWITLYSPAWRDLEKETYRHACVTFVRSHHIRRSLLEQYDVPPEKAVVAYAGCNTRVKNIDLDGKDYRTQNILFVGVAWERKGGRVGSGFPENTAHASACEPDHCWMQPGTGYTQCNDNRQAAGQRGGGLLSARLDLLSADSAEPFGIVFVEAMSYGLPLVAPRTGAVPDFVEDGKNGFLVEPAISTDCRPPSSDCWAIRSCAGDSARSVTSWPANVIPGKR